MDDGRYRPTAECPAYTEVTPCVGLNATATVWTREPGTGYRVPWEWQEAVDMGWYELVPWPEPRTFI